MSKTKRAYKFRFYPSSAQSIILAQTFGCARFVYNWGLHTRKTAYFQYGQQALRHLDRAFVNCFEGRAEYPTFKKKQHDQSASYAANAFTWDGTTLTLAKMHAPLDIHWHRDLPTNSKPSSVTISKDCANRYFVSILVEDKIEPLPVVNKMVGLDLGIKSIVALSTGESVGNPHYFAKDEKRLAEEGLMRFYIGEHINRYHGRWHMHPVVGIGWKIARHVRMNIRWRL